METSPLDKIYLERYDFATKIKGLNESDLAKLVSTIKNESPEAFKEVNKNQF